LSITTIPLALQYYFILFFFFFNATPTTEIYTLSLHDALPISLLSKATGLSKWGKANRHRASAGCRRGKPSMPKGNSCCRVSLTGDRKSTRLNSSHVAISYAVFCLKKKKKKKKTRTETH